MQYRNLGASGLKVSNLCLGAMTFGEADASSFMHGVGSDEATAHGVIERALDAGINFVDTADVYGQDGLSERVIGNWFAATGRRADVVLATKFRFRMGQGANSSGASRRRIVAAAEDSLRRLKTDRIDLYQIHMQDVETPEDETLRALDDLVRAGKVLYIGASNYAAYRLVDSVWTSKARNVERFVSLQMQYSLLHRELEREHVPASLQWGLGIIPWSPLAGGVLSGKYRRGEPVPGDSRMASARFQGRLAAYDNERTWRILDALQAVSEGIGAAVPQVALAWLLAKPAVTSVIFGARNVRQLDENLRASELALSPEAMTRLDEASAFDLGYPYAFMKGIQGRW
ncbi:MAG: aldo/keto reductase [Deltaproteobacteria bacterium]|nr:aldo/keto reductase [Deltaproteobacteria bacterium]